MKRRVKKLKARYAELLAKCEQVVRYGAPPLTDADYEEMAELELEIGRLENPDGPKGDMSSDFVSWREEQARRFQQIAEKAQAARRRGGEHHRGRTQDRDVALAKEFLKRRKTSHLKDTSLKERIAIDEGLNPDTVIKAINRGLKKIQP